MDSGQYKRLSQWLRRQIFGREDEKCSKLVIRHVEVGGKPGSDIDSIACEKLTDDDVETICTQIENICVSDAEGTRDFQRYVIQAYPSDEEDENGKKKQGKSFARCVLTFNANDMTYDDEPIGSEPPTKGGLFAQLMRHNEALMRMAMAGSAHVISTQTRMLQQQQEALDKANNRDLETMQLVEGLMSQKNERDLATMNAETKQLAIREMGSKIMMLLPNIVNRLGGKKLLPEKTTPVEQMLKGVLETATPDQLQQLQAILRPEQQMALFEFMAKMAAEKENEQKKPLAVVPSGGKE